MRLENKTALIAGGGQQPGETLGNGRAVALRFAQEGAKVLVADINPDWAEDTCRRIAAEGGEASALALDITDEDQCRAAVEACVERYGRIDILHNNVGRSKGDAGTTDMDADMWDELMAMNLKGMFLTAKHVLPVMREQGSGVILNVSSTSSLVSKSTTITYKTSKGAINTMSKYLAMENAAFGIRVNVILPGLMDTPMAIERRAKERGVERDVIRSERNARVPLGNQMGTAEDVANAALFLASDEAKFITGVILPIDGGLSCKIG